MREELGRLPLRDVPLNHFLHATLGVELDPNTRAKKVQPKTASQPEFERLLKAYTHAETSGLETRLYKPFEALVNYILEMKGHSNLEYVTIAHNALRGSDAERRPDGVLILRNNKTSSPADRKMIRWSQVLVVFEFKHSRSAQDPLDNPLETQDDEPCPPDASFMTYIHPIAEDGELPILYDADDDLASLSSSVHDALESQYESPGTSTISLPLISGTQSTMTAPESLCHDDTVIPDSESHPYLTSHAQPSISSPALSLNPGQSDTRPVRKRTLSDPVIREATPVEEQDGGSPLYLSHLHKRVRQGEPSLDGKPVKLTDREQLASYALEVLSAGGFRRSTLGCYIKHSTIELWHFDRSGGIGSSPFNFGDQPDYLVTVIDGLARATERQFGFEPFIQGRPVAFPTTAKDAIIRFDGERGEKFKILETLSKQRALTGRGTTVFRVKAFKKKDKQAPLRRGEFAAKLSWQPPRRDGEGGLLKEAADKGVTGVPKVYFASDVDKLSDDVRGKLLPYLPTPLPPDNADRILRILIMKPLCRPLYSVKNADTLLIAFKSLVKCKYIC